MFWFACLIVSIRENCPAAQFDIHGDINVFQTNEQGWCYVGVGFGDFGHTVQVHAWENGTTPEIYVNYGHDCPTVNSTKVDGKIFLENSAQYAIFGFKASSPTPTNITVSIASTVRPIHPNSVQTTIYGFFLFFCVNFVLTGFLQFYYFKNAMDPNEYRVTD